MNTILAADLFCGAGGTSTGLMLAANERERRVELTAVNHWELAVETHAQNHPGARHLCQSVDSIDPRKAIPGGRLDLLVASPECTHHSRARGGRPMQDQSRATAWNILNWCDALDVRSLIVENVQEFQDWGPLYADNHSEEALRSRPVPEQKGKFFRNFVRNLRTLGYSVDWKVLNCADYGDATTRRRLFLRADKGARRVKYPEASHHPLGTLDLTGQSWIPARDIIDWTLPGRSIFGRKIPLAEATIRRIEAGLRRFCGLPYVVIFRNNQTAHGVDDPLGALTCSGANFGLCQPFVIGQQSCAAPRGVGDPIPTVATAGAISLVQPFLIGAGGPSGSGKPVSVDAPLGTLLAENHRAVCRPFLTEYHGGEQGSRRVRSVADPLCTLDTSNRVGPVQPFLVSYYGNGDAVGLGDPLDTVTTRDRFGLCQPIVRGADGREYLLDVLFRMLQPGELAAAHSFPSGYRFAGNREAVVKQIGNSVPVRTAQALCGSVIDRWAA